MNKRKYYEEQFFKTLALATTVFNIILLAVLLITILVKGLPSLSWEMITESPKGGFYFGKEGGILNAILGSLLLGIGSTLLAVAIGVPVALFMNVYLIKYNNRLHYIRFLLDVLWGVPSIVYGAFGFAVMLYMGAHTSLLAGIITLALLVTPIVIRSMDEVLQAVPIGLLESSLALGSTRTEASYKVVLRQALPGLATAVLLAFGRGVGDTASVLFTAGFTDNLPSGLNEPVASLPLAIFFQLSSSIPEVRQRAFAAVLILTVIILTLSLTARAVSGLYQKHKL